LVVLKSKILSPIFIITGFLFFYYISGIINLSEYRGYISELLWSKLLVISLLAFMLGYIIFSLVLKNQHSGRNIISTSVYKSGFILIMALIAAVIITLQNGILLLNPAARGNVSAVLQYLVEFSIPVVILLFNTYRKSHSKQVILLVFATTLLLFSLGYRNQPMILLICIFLSLAIA
ncbi:hypothetical protein CHI12_01120, partial [Terribacillus saccharophilus]